jgi:glucosamine 6-phosphate synthetase-like amidotransferase/phosphosugar isomerase protein
MCGIMGYTGKGNAVPVIIDGLSKLEYRGYDSSGIAMYEDGKIQVYKKKGRLADMLNVLGQEPLSHLGIGHISRTIKSRTRVPYYPDAGLIWVKLTVEPDSRQLLGGQIVGFSGAGKRIDTIAAALASRCKIDDLYNLDLAYSPPFSPLWDPVLTAINRF